MWWDGAGVSLLYSKPHKTCISGTTGTKWLSYCAAEQWELKLQKCVELG